jgi:hypothetical protein
MKKRLLIFASMIGLAFSTSLAQTANCLNFDGTDDYVGLTGPANNIPVGNSAYTIEAWINTAVFPSDGSIVGWGEYNTTGNNTNGFRLTNFPVTGLVNYWWGQDLNAPYTFSANTWYHVAATYDPTLSTERRKIFVNGVKIAADNPTGHVILSANNFTIGRSFGSYFNGSIDEVRIWNVARSENQISSRRFCELTGTEPGLVAYYPFNQGIAAGANTSVTSLTDATSNANNGTLNNFGLNAATSNWISGSAITSGLSVPSAPILPSNQPASSLVTVADLSPAPSSTIKWYNTATGGTALNPTDNLVCFTNYYAAAVNANGCESTRDTFTYLANIPNINACNGQTVNVNYSSACPPGSITWTNNNTTLGLVASGTGSLPSFTATNTTASPIVATVTASSQYTDTITQIFSMTGSSQTFTVPSGITSIHIEAYGAQGSNSGNLGGFASGDLTVAPGAVLQVNVGQQSSFGSGTFGGGGNSSTSFYDGSGGGASDIRTGSYTLSERVLVAYGGGGKGTNNQNPLYNGGDATATAGGAGGTGNTYNGVIGSQGIGGTGGGYFIFGNTSLGGGGGGGYFGGGGGGVNVISPIPPVYETGDGGNGSSYIGGISNGIVTPNVNNNQGQIIISYTIAQNVSTPFTITVNPSPSVSASSPAAICSGSNTSLNALLSGTFCQPTYSQGTQYGDYISRVQLNTLLVNSLGAASPFYTLYPDTGSATTTLVAGATDTIRFRAGTYTSNDFAAWIDYNQNNVFETSEKLGQVLILGASPAEGKIGFTVPTTAFNGKTRMRVRELDGAINVVIDPCAVQSAYGEVEDYTITITGGVANPNFVYAWSPATFLSSTSVSNPTVTAATATTNYTVTATSLAGCSDTATVTVTVNALPTVTANASSAAVCAGNSTTLTGGGASSYAWNNGVTNGIAFTPTATNTYIVTGTDANGCADTALTSVTVNPLPTATVSAPFTALCAGTPAALTGTPAGGTYSVVSGNAAALSGNTFNAPSTGTYKIAYSYTDANGCSDSAQINFNVNCVLGINALNKANIVLNALPNPTTGIVSIEILNANFDKASIQLLGMNGQLLERLIYTGKTSIDLSKYASGIYYINVSNDQIHKTIKVVKE